VAGYTITNTYSSPRINVTMTKVWSGGVWCKADYPGAALSKWCGTWKPCAVGTSEHDTYWTGFGKDAMPTVWNIATQLTKVAVPAGYSKSVVGLNDH